MFEDKLAALLKQQVASQAENDIRALLARPELKEHGDFSFPCFSLSKLLRRSPAQIAQELAGKLERPVFIDKIEAVGGYVNFFLNRTVFFETVMLEILKQKTAFGSSGEGRGKTSLVEHTSINPNASPHIGRARNAIIGDFITRLLRFEGYEVDVHYFVNDIGKQISMLVLGSQSLKEIRFADLLDIYVSINQKIKDDPQLETQVFDLLYQLENGDEAVKKQFREIVDICIAGQSKIFNELGIHYDCFDYESQFLFDNSLEDITEQLQNANLLFEDEEGRLVVNIEDRGLPPLVVTRSDKTSLYPLRDIAYTIWKARQGKDKNMIVLGQDQQLYFQQIAAVVSALGHTPPEVVHYSFVMLVDGKMSTRQGTVVLLEDFMAEAAKKAEEEMRGRGHEVDEALAKKIAYASVKYSMEKTSNERNVIFDWDNALSFEGDTGPYLLYSYVRIHSILRKTGHAVDFAALNCACLTQEAEYDLIKALADFPNAVQLAKKDFSPHVITHYAFELARKFSAFYHACAILNAEQEAVRNARLCLILCVKQTFKNAFYLLGIEPIEYM
ncbi:MAG: arginine--tRNA ligase [Oscillospiraceae bacterium]|jgi:arginyl-tRNA synthetase|nr:arginine--tRNA ligase [Oscillospiraceae bacterium]